jgi:proteasome lid subunit RPN8/RPN11
MELVIPSQVLARIRDEAAQAFPEEGCGLLIGERGPGERMEVRDLVPAPNVAPDRRQHFEVDPAVHLRCQRRLRGSGQQVIGHYHSHPGGRAEPSPTDAESITDPAMVWVIVALEGADLVGAVRAWRVSGDKADFREVSLLTQ